MTTISYESPLPGRVRAGMFAALGLRVFPLVSNGKKIPAITKWPERATTDVNVIQEWWTERPHLECGILTGPESGIWVLDPDRHPDKTGKIVHDGLENVREVFRRHGVDTDPETFRVASPNGEQWWFAYPPEGKVGNYSYRDNQKKPRVAPGVDVRGWHGQVMAPFGVGRRILNDTWPPVRAPEWLEEMVIVPAYVEHVPTYVNSNEIALSWARRLSLQLAGVGTGGRNAALNTTAFKLGLLGARGLLDEGTAWDLLEDACRYNGLLEDDGEHGFRATLASGWNAGLREGVQ